jgi:hypothetical protein
MGNNIEVYGKTIGLQFGKLADGSSVALWKMRNWTLWRGRPPLKRKKSLHTKQELVMLKYRPPPHKRETERKRE